MYTSSMKRTQIYLSNGEVGVLRRKAKESGRTVSDLIRDAVDRAYLKDTSKLIATLDKTRGAWPRRSKPGAEYVEQMRHGRLAGLNTKPRR
jgi:hypothetical protein